MFPIGSNMGGILLETFLTNVFPKSFVTKYTIGRIIRMFAAIDAKQQEHTSLGRIRCRTYYTTLNFDLNHDLALRFLICKVKFCNRCISGMDGPIDMKSKGYKSTGWLLHGVILHISLTFDFQGWILKISISDELLRKMADFCHSFVTLGSRRYTRGNVIKVGVSPVGILVNVLVIQVLYTMYIVVGYQKSKCSWSWWAGAYDNDWSQGCWI